MNQQEILNHISIINVKNKLGLEEVCSIGDTIYVKCPFCCSLKGEMKLNTKNNSYICKECETSGYAISLYAKFYNIRNKDAYNILLKKPCSLENNLKTTINHNRKDAEELDDVYNKFLEMLNLDNKHLSKLLKLGFSVDEIKSIGFKTIPTREDEKIKLCDKLLNLGYDLQGIPRFLPKFKV